MELMEGPIGAVLSTTGRRTGRSHSVLLRAVYHNGRFYFSRRNPDSDWLKNAIANPRVSVTVDNSTVQGLAVLVSDHELSRKISGIKYTDARSEESRVVLEVTPHGLS